MICPVCTSKTAIIESRFEKKANTTRRRHECKECFTRFTTRESIIIDSFTDYTRKHIRHDVEVIS